VLHPLTFDYHDSHVAISNTGRTVQYNYDSGSSLAVGDTRYELIQFHFHAHSEHALNGTIMPMEVHLVHQDASGRLLVVGVFVAQAEHNATLDQLHWPSLPSAEAPKVEPPNHVFNALILVPIGPTYRYVGSLTAPPCTGDVSWILFQRPIAMDASQIETFTRLYAHNARTLQPLGERGLPFGEKTRPFGWRLEARVKVPRCSRASQF
jgi:carbonic anhydrase